MDTGNQMLYTTCVTFFNGTLVLLFNRKFVPCFSFFVFFVLFCQEQEHNKNTDEDFYLYRYRRKLISIEF